MQGRCRGAAGELQGSCATRSRCSEIASPSCLRAASAVTGDTPRAPHTQVNRLRAAPTTSSTRRRTLGPARPVAASELGKGKDGLAYGMHTRRPYIAFGRWACGPGVCVAFVLFVLQVPEESPNGR